jgi:hypothetical protein
MFKGEGTYRQRYLIVAEAMLIRWIASKASGQRRIDAREVAFLALTQLTVKRGQEARISKTTAVPLVLVQMLMAIQLAIESL